jgi:hypothetical protein
MMTYNATHSQAKVKLLRQSSSGLVDFGDSRSCSLLLFGTTYQQIGERHDRRLAPQLGRSIEVAGRTLNIYCSGEGSPTVIFEGDWRFPATAGYTFNER